MVDTTKHSKFALIVFAGAGSRLRKSVQLTKRASVHQGIPFDLNYTIWEKWLGSIRADYVKSANLVFLVHNQNSKEPAVIDAENAELEEEVKGVLFATLTFGVFRYAHGLQISGGSNASGPDARSVGDLFSYVKNKGERFVLEDSMIPQIAGVFDGIQKCYQGNKQYERVRKGFSTYLASLTRFPFHERFHQLVRSIEALLLCRNGSTAKDFRERALAFVTLTTSNMELLGRFYAFRGKFEHFQDLTSLFGGKEPCNKEMDRHLRQVSALARHIYQQVFTDLDLLKHFETPLSLERMWLRKPKKVLTLVRNKIDLDSIK